jgi:hypothetical protein
VRDRRLDYDGDGPPNHKATASRIGTWITSKASVETAMAIACHLPKVQ